MPRYTDDQLADALVKTKGMIFLAAKTIGCDWHTMDSRIKKSARLQAVVAEQSGQVLDTAELKLYSSIIDGDLGAIKYILSTKGKGRGYVERKEVTGEDGAALTIDLKWPDAKRPD